MSCYLSSSCFRNSSVEEAINECISLNVNHVEMSAPHKYQNNQELSVIFKNYLEKGIKFNIHNYFPPQKKNFVLNIASDKEEVRENCNSLVTSTLDLCEVSKSKVYAIHAGYLSNASGINNGFFEFEKKKLSYDLAIENSASFLNKINDKFSKTKTKLAVENLFPAVSKKLSLFCNLSEIKELMQKLPSSVGLLLDFGHLNVTSNIENFDKFKFLEEYIELFGDRIFEIHMSENNGLKDEHLPVLKGSWQLEALSMIKNFNLKSDNEIVICLESRNANKEEIKESLETINKTYYS
jgi:sugar phosphate isomerase/epimerase